MPKLKKGDTYCTMWTTGLKGPYVFDGKSNLMFTTLITADVDTLNLAALGFDMVMKANTTDNGELVVPFDDLANAELIDTEIALLEVQLRRLNAFKELSPQIRKALTGE